VIVLAFAGRCTYAGAVRIRPSTMSQSATSKPADPAPVAPTPPGLDDCCRSGCTPCVFDLYEDALDRYRAALAAWQARQAA
jgi:hypothetical protein